MIDLSVQNLVGLSCIWLYILYLYSCIILVLGKVNIFNISKGKVGTLMGQWHEGNVQTIMHNECKNQTCLLPAHKI